MTNALIRLLLIAILSALLAIDTTSAGRRTNVIGRSADVVVTMPGTRHRVRLKLPRRVELIGRFSVTAATRVRLPYGTPHCFLKSLQTGRCD